MATYIPKNYCSKLNIRQTEIAIKRIKDFFERAFASELSLTRVSAPLFVLSKSGLNDDLNGVERPVKFDVLALNHAEAEIVHSLAKWKRAALHRYEFNNGEGLYTDMNAIRRDEELDDNIHSIYVDQWDWEKIILKENRCTDTLVSVVRAIFKVLRLTENFVTAQYPELPRLLPEDITFISSQELLNMYPELTAKEREDEICKKHKAVFITQIGKKLTNGQPHDNRAPDYDDWELNGDLLIWYPLLNRAIEITSMGIRVDENSLVNQLNSTGCSERLQYEYHKNIKDCNYPYTIGGGLGQSRICMMLLAKAHIGEVQASIWPLEMIEQCERANINLL